MGTWVEMEDKMGQSIVSVHGQGPTALTQMCTDHDKTFIHSNIVKPVTSRVISFKVSVLLTQLLMPDLTTWSEEHFSSRISKRRGLYAVSTGPALLTQLTNRIDYVCILQWSSYGSFVCNSVSLQVLPAIIRFLYMYIHAYIADSRDKIERKPFICNTISKIYFDF